MRELELKNEQLEERVNEEIFRGTNRTIETKQVNRPVEEVQSGSSIIDQLIKDFEDRCDFVETNTQTVTERLDSCEQKFF